MKDKSKNRIIEAMDFDSDTSNWKHDFKVMSKRYGRDFIDTMKAMWSANYDVQTEDEFCKMNGIPKGFFEKVIKNNKGSR